MSNYGLPDIYSIFEHRTKNVNFFIYQLENLIKNYEKRIKKINIEKIKDCHMFLLKIRITVQLFNEELFQFTSIFQRCGNVIVSDN